MSEVENGPAGSGGEMRQAPQYPNESGPTLIRTTEVIPNRLLSLPTDGSQSLSPTERARLAEFQLLADQCLDCQEKLDRGERPEYSVVDREGQELKDGNGKSIMQPVTQIVLDAWKKRVYTVYDSLLNNRKLAEMAADRRAKLKKIDDEKEAWVTKTLDRMNQLWENSE